MSLNYTENPNTPLSSNEFVDNAVPSAPAVGRILVLIDVNKFSQVLRNLINNAIKFTKPGGRVSVSARFEPNSLIPSKHVESGSLIVEVSDSGHGISKVRMWECDVDAM